MELFLEVDETFQPACEKGAHTWWPLHRADDRPLDDVCTMQGIRTTIRGSSGSTPHRM